MNILHVSASHMDEANHAFAFHFKETCKKMGINITSISPYHKGTIGANLKRRRYHKDDYYNESFKTAYIGLKPFPISRLVRRYYPCADFVFVENAKFPLDNDDACKIPVIYYHRDMMANAHVRNPSILAYRFQSMENNPLGELKGGQPEILSICYPELWYNDDIKKIWLTHAISEDEFRDLRKFKNYLRKYRGFAYRGSYKSVKEMMGFNNTHYQIYQHHAEIMDYIKKHNLATKFWEVSDGMDGYKKHLFEFDATVIIPAWDSWETRRLYEASYCRCVPILYIQNSNAVKVFQAQGYSHGKTCLTFDRKEDLLDLELDDYDLEKIRDNGYKLVTQRHTYRARIAEFLEKIDIDQILINNGKEEEVKNSVYF